MSKQHISLKKQPYTPTGIVAPGSYEYNAVKFPRLETLLGMRRTLVARLSNVDKDSYIEQQLQGEIGQLDRDIHTIRESKRNG